MSKPENILDTSRLYLQGEFDEQVTQLLGIVRLTKQEVETVNHLVHDVQQAFVDIWPDCPVHCFGSIVTGLGIKTSDVDCYVEIPDWQIKKLGNKIIYKAKHYLEMHGNFTNLLGIANARVPIIKLTHTPTEYAADLNFTNMIGVQNSKLLRYLLHVDRRALPLAVIIKYWSKVHQLTGTNLMPNYVLTLLIIFYLQHLEILPAVHAIQQFVPVYQVNGWNIAFNPIQHHGSDVTCDLYQLLGGFFNFYCSFDFNTHIISTFLGCPLPKDSFKELKNVPVEYQAYLENLQNHLFRPLRMNTRMCVQDVFEHNRNCAMAVHPKIFTKVMKYFRSAAEHFKNKPKNQFLTAILTKTTQRESPKANPNKISKVQKRKSKKLRSEDTWKQYFQMVKQGQNNNRCGKNNNKQNK